MRLDKFLSECSEYSRKDIKKLVKQGVVTVNGQVAQKSETNIDENADEIKLSGEKIEYKKYVYLMLNKPQGYVSAVWDKKLPCVTDLVPDEYKRFEIFPVGRLDIDTEGLLILTNDGELNHKVISPKSNVMKKYFAVLDKEAEEGDIKVFAEGMELSDFVAKPAKYELTEKENEVYITVSEGKFHQVKRMCQKVGKNVVYLKRVKIGSLELDESLPLGKCRELTEKEIENLFTNE